MNKITNTFAVLLLTTTVAQADQVILDDLIVNGSACVGQDCINGESFGFDTLRLKENNLRIRAVDTSTTSSFPSNDWQITFNDSANGGANKFSIDDIDGGKTPFTLEAGAPSHSLYVDDGGRVGFGTSIPIVELHTKSGDSPALRLEQDGSAGFTAQTWDVAGNEANFFIRDVTNGSALPFKIIPGAPTNSLYINGRESQNGYIGMGTATPDSNLDIESSSSVELRLTGTGTTDASWVIKNNEATGRLTFADALNATVPLKIAPNAAENLMKLGINSTDEVTIQGNLVIDSASNAVDWEIKNNSSTGRLTFADANGSTVPVKIAADAVENLIKIGVQNTSEVTINGNLVVSGSITPDYVFAPQYELESITKHAELMWENKHLPSLSPAKTDKNGLGVVNLGVRSQEMLEELEKAHIYIEQLHNTLEKMQSRLAKLELSK